MLRALVITEARRLGITFGQLLAFMAAAVPVLVGLRFAYSTVDVAYLIRAGETMLDEHSLLRVDTFTFAASGDSWLNQQWGAEIVFALLFRLGSWEGLAIVRLALVGLIYWLEFLACRAAGAGYRAAGWLTLCALLVSVDGLTLRPQLFGVAFFVLTLWIVAGRLCRPRSLWWIPVLVLPWVNIHGSFILAPLLLLLTGAEDVHRERAIALRELAVAAACVAIAFLNPFGARIWLYVTSLTTDPEIRLLIEEWQQTRPDSLMGVAFYLSVAAVVFVVFTRRPRLSWPRLVALAVFFALGFQAVRGVMWWALAAPVLIADLFPERIRREDHPALLNVALASVMVVLMAPLLPWFRPLYAADAMSFSATDGLLLHAPASLSEAVEEGTEPGSRVFVEHVWASWFELELPRHPVFVDSRIELFPLDVWNDYLTVVAAGEGWDDVLDRWEVDVLVLSRERSALISMLRTDPSWTLLHRDHLGSVFLRASPASDEDPSP